MAGTSITGTGPGSCGKFTTTQLAILANAPSILIAQYAESVEIPLVSPASFGNTVIFPLPLTGLASNYIVNLTTINGGNAYVVTMNEEDGNFIGFSFMAETECLVMYQVVNVGIKPIFLPRET